MPQKCVKKGKIRVFCRTSSKNTRFLIYGSQKCNTRNKHLLFYLCINETSGKYQQCFTIKSFIMQLLNAAQKQHWRAALSQKEESLEALQAPIY